MGAKNPLKASPFTISTGKNGETVVRILLKMDAATSAPILKQLRHLIKSKQRAAYTFDLGGLTYIDDFGVQVLFEIKELLAARKGKFQLINIPAHARELISQVIFNPDNICVTYGRKKSLDIFTRLGDATIRYLDSLRFMASFLGSVVLAFFHVLLHPKALRGSDTVTYMEKTGVDALPIVALISFLLGLIMAFMSALQLRQFGANIYVASLVSFAMVSELGPIMTAIVVSGRSGSAFAAEIGTMKIAEEVDALFVMGFNPTLFLAIPKIVAAFIMVPLLTLFSDLFGILGGLVIGVTMLDLGIGSYLKQTLEILTLFEVVWGLLKSAVFAVIIAWIGCLRGFQTRGGASGVGNAATSAVVISIFLIILFDSIFAVLRSYWR